MVDKHEEITLPIVLSCNYQSDITYPGQKQFDCGNPVIDKFVRASLKKDLRNSDCAAKALIDRQSGELIGICTFTAYSLNRTRFWRPSGFTTFRNWCLDLVMLGVAWKYQKRGFGQDLLCDFFEHVKIIHQALPIKGVYLDADPAAINFYARLGFVQLSSNTKCFWCCTYVFGDSAYSRGLDYYRHPPGQVLPQPGAEQRIYHFCSIAPAFSNSTSLPLMVAVAATIVVLTVAQIFAQIPVYKE